MQTLFTGHLALKLTPRWDALSVGDKAAAKQEMLSLFADYQQRVTLRGAYVTQGFQADTDLLLWLHAPRFEDMQDLQLGLRRSRFGKSVDEAYAFVGITKPFEFSEHPASFEQGIPPKEYLCFYPFVRTAEYYLLPKGERRGLIEEHGEIGHPFTPDILTNGVYAFGLGNYEWLLSFETDDLSRLVDAVRALRASKTRLYMKHEWPFIVGRRFEIEKALSAYDPEA